MTESPYPESWLRHPEWIEAEKDDPHFAGVHYYADLHGCLKRAVTPHDDGGEDASYGTNLHAALDKYHSGETDLGNLNLTPPKASCSEYELMSRYTARFPPGRFGETLMGERRLRGTITIRGIEYPIAGTLDRVTRLGPQEVVALANEFGLLIEPGIYGHDFKTKKQHTGTTMSELIAANQHTLYLELLKQNLPEAVGELKGFLFHLLYRYVKESPESFRCVKADVPTEFELAQLRTLIREGSERLARLGPNHMSPTRCFDYFRQCPLYNQCSRENESALAS